MTPGREGGCGQGSWGPESWLWPLHSPAMAAPGSGGWLGLANWALPCWAGPGRTEPTRQPPCPIEHHAGGSFLLPRSMLTGKKVAHPGPKVRRRGCLQPGPDPTDRPHGVRSPRPPHPSEPLLGIESLRVVSKFQVLHDPPTHSSGKLRPAAGQAQKSCPYLGRHPLPLPWPSRPQACVQLAGPCPPTPFPCRPGGPGSPLLQGALPPQRPGSQPLLPVSAA